MKIRLSAAILAFGYALAFPALAALELDPEIEKLLKGSGITEDGTVYNMDNRATEATDYIKSNWRELVPNIDEVPTHVRHKQSAALLVGLVAEDLPPAEYVDFLDAYLEPYSKGKVTDDALMLQLFGQARKNDFLLVNWNHPRVKSFLKRADELAGDNSDLHDLIAKIASGELADMYLVNKSDNAPPPETLPGIKLRRPFESMLGGTSSSQSGPAKLRPIKEVSAFTQAPQSPNFPLPIFVGVITALGSGIWFWIRRRKAS